VVVVVDIVAHVRAGVADLSGMYLDVSHSVSHSVRRRPARPALPALPHARVVPSYPCGQPMPEGCGIGGRLGAPGGE
jgi:hypothetical protein